VKANTLMARSWPRIETLRRVTTLCSALSELAIGPLVEHKGATVFRELITQGLGDPVPADLTGYEALTNKIHVSDYVEAGCAGDALLVQGMLFAEAVLHRLAETRKPARVLLSRDVQSGEVTVRFFVRRPAQPWGADNPDDYQAEEVVQWDV
jgi:hypothetical protein